MAPRRKASQDAPPATDATVFDREHLVRYTMHSPELEREIINLFLGQLPSTVEMLRAAHSAESWKLATHTLKGSAAAVGARKINEISSHLESCGIDGDVKVKSILMADLEQATADFRAMVGRIYSSL